MSGPPPITAGDLTWIAVIVDANTPPDLVQYDGRIVGIPTTSLAVIGSGIDNPGKLVGVPGYVVPGGPTGTQFLLTAPLDPTTTAAVHTIPNPKVWGNATFEQVYRDVATILISTYGVPAPDVRAGLKQLYDAAVGNDHL